MKQLFDQIHNGTWNKLCWHVSHQLNKEVDMEVHNLIYFKVSDQMYDLSFFQVSGQVWLKIKNETS